MHFKNRDLPFAGPQIYFIIEKEGKTEVIKLVALSVGDKWASHSW